MARIGIAVDDWKLPIFQELLTDAQFEYETGPGLTDDMKMLYVDTTEVGRLARVVERCQVKAAEAKN